MVNAVGRSVEVRLQWYEVAMAAQVGMLRFVESRRKKYNPRECDVSGGKGWAFDIDGAAAELVVAKYLGMYWSGSVNTYKEGADVGENIQVRHTAKGRKLIVRDDDRDDHCFWLVTGDTPNYVIRGWLWGRDAKQSHYLDKFGKSDLPPAYGVPSDQLNDPESWSNLWRCRG